MHYADLAAGQGTGIGMALLNPDRRSPSAPSWIPVIAGLVVAAIAAWLVSDLPRSRSLTAIDLMSSSAARALLVFLLSAATAYLLARTIVGMSRPAGAHLAFKISINGLWLIPVAIFLREHSPWTMVMTAIFVASTIRVLPLPHDSPDPENRPTDQFILLPSSGWSWQRASAIAAAFCAQTGALAGLGGYTITSSLLAGAGSAVWASSYLPSLLSPLSPSRSASRGAALAILCTALGLLPYLRISLRIPGFGASVRTHALPGLSKGKLRSSAGAPPSTDAATGSGGGHVGIVLWAPEERHTKFIAPPPVTATNRFSNSRAIDPLIIPFDGVYWYFKSPDTTPPQTSRQAHGTPEQYDIQSADWHPLSMEAHESLGTLIDLDCCSRIRIAIRNKDRYPETVSLELVLTDTTLPGRPSQSLGSATVKSTRLWHEDEKPLTTSETLDFAIPAKHTLHRFDQMMVIFRLDIARADTGAKMAIERFVLIPRGM